MEHKEIFLTHFLASGIQGDDLYMISLEKLSTVLINMDQTIEKHDIHIETDNPFTVHQSI